jgi:ubiquinone/menaquinone biosynthesis C-methylase UbiE
MTNEIVQGTWENAVHWLREQPNSTDILRDAYFDDPLIGAAERYWQSNEWQAVREIIGNGPGQALDVGAGRGIASFALAKDGFSVTALEPDPSDIVGGGAIHALAAQTGLSIQVEQNISERLPFADASFDVVYARAVLHHIKDLPAAMREFNRVLRKGGLFVATREHVISDSSQLPAFFAGHLLHHRYGGENAYPLHFYQNAIRGSGLRLERTIGSLESPINFGPQSVAEVNRRIAEQLTPASWLRPLATSMINLPGAGRLVRRVASKIDRRPGRHAAFIARKVQQ